MHTHNHNTRLNHQLPATVILRLSTNTFITSLDTEGVDSCCESERWTKQLQRLQAVRIPLYKQIANFASPVQSAVGAWSWRFYKYTNFESRYCLVGAAPRIAGPLKNVFDSLISLFKAILESGLLEQGLGGTTRRTTRIIKIPCRKWLKVITSPLRPRAA